MEANLFGRSLFPEGFIFEILRFFVRFLFFFFFFFGGGGGGGGGSWGHLLLFFEIFQIYDICVFFLILTPED